MTKRIRPLSFQNIRINLTIYKLDRVMEGDLEETLHALHQFDLEERLEEQMKQTASD